MPKQLAQPKPKPPQPKPRPGRVFSTKDQEQMWSDADKLAEELGWQGAGDLVLHDIQVRDAKRYLRKIMHEVHQSALTPERDTPEAAKVCAHLGVTDPEEIALVERTIAEVYDREVAEAPANPTSVPDARAVTISANLKGSASSMLDNLARGRK